MKGGTKVKSCQEGMWRWSITSATTKAITVKVARGKGRYQGNEEDQ